MTFNVSQLERVFDTLQIEWQPSSRMRMGYLIDDAGKKLFPPICFSRARAAISSAEAHRLRRQLLLTAHDFERLLRCQMTRREYFDRRRYRISS